MRPGMRRRDTTSAAAKPAERACASPNLGGAIPMTRIVTVVAH